MKMEISPYHLPLFPVRSVDGMEKPEMHRTAGLETNGNLEEVEEGTKKWLSEIQICSCRLDVGKCAQKTGILISFFLFQLLLAGQQRRTTKEEEADASAADTLIHIPNNSTGSEKVKKQNSICFPIYENSTDFFNRTKSLSPCGARREGPALPGVARRRAAPSGCRTCP